MSSAISSSYWCYRCNGFVRVWASSSNNQDFSSISCPDCYGGFVEEIDSSPLSPPSPSPHLGFPAMYMVGTSTSDHHQISSSPRLRRSRRNGVDRSPFNPVIVLRAPTQGEAGGGGYDLYYDDGGGSGLRPLPASVSEFLLGSGFDRLLDQLAQIEINGIGGTEQPPASKAAIESMPTIEIAEAHVTAETHCAVCKEAFELKSEAREMPCKHIYHPDCILPWLSIRNSCPVCRLELPSDAPRLDSPEFTGGAQNEQQPQLGDNEDEAVGLTIWRLPGGGFAVGRFSGGRRGGERELPVVYTEMDGGFNQGGAPRRISWGTRGRMPRNSGGFQRVFRRWFSCFGGNQSSDSTSSSSDLRIDQRARSLSLFSSASRRRGRGLDMGNRTQRW